MVIKLLWLLFLTWRTIEGLNFLLIIADDLRPALGSYGDKNAFTPNINNLAENSVLFTRAYAQQALCAPSRNSFLTSRRPDTLHLYDFYSYWRNTVGNFTTLPEHLKNHGYKTKSIGKIFHPGISSNYSDDSPYSWTEKPFHPFTNRFENLPICQSLDQSLPAANLVCPVSLDLMPRGTLPDLEILEAAKQFIRDQKSEERPFFLGVGFRKPHIPLKYPREYLDYHPLSKFNISYPYEWPKNISDVAYNIWSDIRLRDDVRKLRLKFPWERIPEDFAKTIIQSYYAAVTYVDDLVGMLLEELRCSELQDDTVVILTSDHGWSLGEHAEWAKYSNFETALRVPLIISIPRKRPQVEVTNIGRSGYLYPKTDIQERQEEDSMKLKKQATRRIVGIQEHPKKCKNDEKSGYEIFKDENHILRTDAMVELVDIFPTIAELAGFPITVCEENQHSSTKSNPSSMKTCSEGISLVPLIQAAINNEVIPWKSAAFSQYPRPGIKPTLKPNTDKPRLSDITIMGYTLRTQKYRYTAWTAFDSTTKKPDWKRVLAEELYDHSLDSGENSNLAMDPKFFNVKSELRKLLQCGWRKALPFKLGTKVCEM